MFTSVEFHSNLLIEPFEKAWASEAPDVVFARAPAVDIVRVGLE